MVSELFDLGSMADATHATCLSVMSKQIEDNKQATDDLKAHMADLMKSQSHIEAMLSQFISQKGAQTNRAPILNASPSGCLTNSTMTPLLPEPPDPPDFNQFGQRLSKLEFPVFDGTLLDCWIAKVDRFFELEQYENEEKLNLISLSLEGAALKWFRRHKREFTDWTYIKRKLMARFGLVKGCSPPEVLPKEESEPHKKKSHQIETFEVLSSLETSHRCHKIHNHNHYESLDVVDERMCNELVCDEDDDSIITKSAKFHETYEEPQSELVCLKQSHDSVENYLGSFEYALTRSSMQHTPTNQYGAPSNPYQNFNDQCHYKREFGNHTEPGIEFDRASEEVEDDELQDKQPEDDNSMVENQKKLARKIEIPVFESLHEPSRLFDEESQGILGDHTLAPMKPYQSYSQSWYELDTIQSDINFKVLVARECDMVSVVVIYEVATTFEKLAKTWKFKFKSNPRRSKLLDDMFSLMEKSSEKYVMVWAERENETIKKSFKGLSKVEKDHKIEATVLVFLGHTFSKITSGWIKDQKQGAINEWSLFLQMLQTVKDRKNTNGVIIQVMVQRQWETFVMMLLTIAERLIQSDAPPILSDLLCVKNQTQGRLKMVLLLEFLWLILFTSKMFKSSNAPQNKNQTDQKLSSYWKLLLSWKISQNILVSSRCVLRQEESYVKVLELIKVRDSRKRKLCKNWWFKYKLNTWLSEAFHHTGFVKIIQTFSPMINDTHWDKETWVKLNPESCKGGSLLEFLKRHEARFDMIKVPNNTKFFYHLKFLVESYTQLLGCKFVKFTMEQFEKPLITILSYEWFHSPRPPELSRYKEDEESTAIGSVSAIGGENEAKVQKFSSLRTRMFSRREYCNRKSCY